MGEARRGAREVSFVPPLFELIATTTTHLGRHLDRHIVRVLVRSSSARHQSRKSSEEGTGELECRVEGGRLLMSRIRGRRVRQPPRVVRSQRVLAGRATRYKPASSQRSTATVVSEQLSRFRTAIAVGRISPRSGRHSSFQTSSPLAKQSARSSPQSDLMKCQVVGLCSRDGWVYRCIQHGNRPRRLCQFPPTHATTLTNKD